MIVYVDNEQRIKAVGSSLDETLTPLEIIDDDDNPFKDWSNAKICAYKCTVQDGHVTMYTPYVASSALDYIDSVGKELEEKAMAADILLGKVEV